MLWKPTDTLSATLVGDWNKQDAVCCGSVFVRTGATQRPLARQYAALAAAQGYAVPKVPTLPSREDRARQFAMAARLKWNSARSGG